MFIDQLNAVTDLDDGDRAAPEPGTAYRLRTIHGKAIDAGDVTEVVRQGDALYARTSSGQSFPITGDGSPVLVPFRR